MKNRGGISGIYPSWAEAHIGAESPCAAFIAVYHRTAKGKLKNIGLTRESLGTAKGYIIITLLKIEPCIDLNWAIASAQGMRIANIRSHVYRVLCEVASSECRLSG